MSDDEMEGDKGKEAKLDTNRKWRCTPRSQTLLSLSLSFFPLRMGIHFLSIYNQVGVGANMINGNKKYSRILLFEYGMFLV